MDKKTFAIQQFKSGYNCAQSVVTAFAGELSIGYETAIRIASGFGGGMGRQQLTCGALTGAYMIIGYLHGMHAPDDDLANEKAAKMIQKFTADFKEKYGHADCFSLMGVDLNTEEGKKEAEDKNLYELKCEKFILETVEMLEREYMT
jgi:C_GCAxxG_C_C family probable redox protein